MKLRISASHCTTTKKTRNFLRVSLRVLNYCIYDGWFILEELIMAARRDTTAKAYRFLWNPSEWMRHPAIGGMHSKAGDSDGPSAIDYAI